MYRVPYIVPAHARTYTSTTKQNMCMAVALVLAQINQTKGDTLINTYFTINALPTKLILLHIIMQKSKINIYNMMFCNPLSNTSNTATHTANPNYQHHRRAIEKKDSFESNLELLSGLA